MLSIKLICVGKMKEKFYIAAAAEYIKRLSAYCRLEVEEIPETKLPENASAANENDAMEKEAAAILAAVPKSAAVVAMCIEGEQSSSEEFSAMLDHFASSGVSKLCFIIGGSNGLHGSVKRAAARRLSMSKMTFPHHLARVMLLEQIYRGFKISEGGKYHK